VLSERKRLTIIFYHLHCLHSTTSLHVDKLEQPTRKQPVVAHWLDVYVSSIYDLKAFISSHVGAATEERRSTSDIISVLTVMDYFLV
jgi:hypothetical protein